MLDGYVFTYAYRAQTVVGTIYQTLIYMLKSACMFALLFSIEFAS